jgi:serine/threonine-protein kinase
VNDGAPLVQAPDPAEAEADPLLGRVLAGRFTILSRLGSGSMGTVYRANQAPIGRQVALKILRTDRAIDDASRARFLREARANSALTSPNTVTVFDFGQSESGEFYLAMELLEGESVGDRIRRLGRLQPLEALDAAQQALRSLAEAHAKGIIHRDLKPDNLFFSRVATSERYDEVVKVLDFGVAKMLRDDGDLAMNAIETQAGTVFGTPRYMSPEQAQGKSLDARTDLYSLGVILYHMLAGQPPFTDDDAIVVMARHIKSNPVPLREAAPFFDIPEQVEAMVMRALSKEPDERPGSAEEMLDEIQRAAGGLVAAPRGAGLRASLAPPGAVSAPTAEDTWNSHSLRPVQRRRPAKRPVLAVLAAATIAGVCLALGARWVAARNAAEATPAPTSQPPPQLSTVVATNVAEHATPPTLAPTPVPVLTPDALPLVPRTGPGSSVGASVARPTKPLHAAPSAAASANRSVKQGTKPQVGYGYLE